MMPSLTAKKLGATALSAWMALWAGIGAAQVVDSQVPMASRAGIGGAGLEQRLPMPGPPERTGLPVPVEAQFQGGARVGALGQGWDMPINHVRVDTAPVGRLPRASGTDEQVSLRLQGVALTLVPGDSSGAVFIPRETGTNGELTRTGDGWEYRSGHLRYVFEPLRASDGSLLDGGFFPLREIHGLGESRVEIRYRIDEYTNLGGSGAGYFIPRAYQLRYASVAYNFAPGSAPGQLGCAKHHLDFAYQSAKQGHQNYPVNVEVPSSTTLAAGEIVPARVTVDVLTEVRLRVNPSEGCLADLSGYAQGAVLRLGYENDPATGLLRLAKAEASGTSTSRLPLADYRYGDGGTVGFEPDDQQLMAAATLPAGYKGGINRSTFHFIPARTRSSATQFPPLAGTDDAFAQVDYRRLRPGDPTTWDLPALTVKKTWNALTDMTCDGLPDLVFLDDSSGKLKLAVNTSREGQARFASPRDLFEQGTALPPAGTPLHYAVTANIEDVAYASTTGVFVALHDINGDGCQDLIDARGAGDYWTAYINAPADLRAAGDVLSPAPSAYAPSVAGSPIFWMANDVPIGTVRRELARKIGGLGQDTYPSKNGWLGGEARLALRWELHGIFREPWQEYSFWSWPVRVRDGRLDDEFAVGDCAAHVKNRTPNRACAWRTPPGEEYVFYRDGGKARSVTLFDLHDVNGDSYLDFVMLDTDAAAWPNLLTNRYVESEQALGAWGPRAGHAHFPWEHSWRDAAAGVGCPPRLNGSGSVFDGDHSYCFCDQRDLSDASCSRSDWSIPTCGLASGIEQCAQVGDSDHSLEDGGILPQRFWVAKEEGLDLGRLESPVYRVYLNRVGARLGEVGNALGLAGGVFEEAGRLLGPTECPGLEAYASTHVPAGDRRRDSRFLCGLQDANGDGRLDLVVGSTALLGRGLDFSDVWIRLPSADGPTATSSVQPLCTTWPGRVHPEFADAGGSESGTSTLYAWAQVQRRDLDGDGLNDTLTPFRWGTAQADATLAPARDTRINGAPPVYAEYGGWSASQSACETGANTTAGLADFTGDGALDYVRVEETSGGSRLRISQLARFDHETGYWADRGLLTQKRLVSVTDGYGAGEAYTYRNAKLADDGSLHRVPAAEIVLSEIVPVVPGNDPDVPAMEPTRFAYGGIQMHYDSAAERFVPTGYRRHVTLRGRRQGLSIKGQAEVFDALAPADPDVFAREPRLRPFLIGQPRATFSVEGLFQNAEEALGWDLDSAVPQRGVRVRQISRHEIALRPVSSLELPPAYRGVDCRYVGWGYGVDHDLLDEYPTQPVQPDYWCAQQATAYVREIKIESGKLEQVPFENSNPRSLTKQTVDQVDTRGRPLTVRGHGKLTDATDDVCTALEYAAPEAGSPFDGKRYAPLGLLKSQKITDCGTRVLTQEEIHYDGLPSVGVFRAGLESQRKRRYERTEGGLIADSAAIRTASLTRNAFGQISMRTLRFSDPLSTLSGALARDIVRSDVLTYDDWSLQVVDSSLSGTDVTGSQVQTLELDPVQMNIRRRTDGAGAITRFYYDTFGRPTRTTLSHPLFANGTEHIVSATEYLADAADSHTGRTMRTKQFMEWTPASSYDPAPNRSPARSEQWTDTHFDALGRVKYTERHLGADAPYYGAKLRSGVLQYDSLGRLAFMGSPYDDANSAAAPTLWGKTFLHADLSTEPDCVVHSAGRVVLGTSDYVRVTLTTSERVNGLLGQEYSVPRAIDPAVDHDASERRVDCSVLSYGYDGVTEFSIPATELVTTAASKAVAVEATDIDLRGRVSETRRWSDGGTLGHQARFIYDRFGRLTQYQRFRTPSLTNPANPVTWSYAYDGLGRMTRMQQPLSAVVSTLYDDQGNVSAVDYAEAGEVKRLAYQYDGFGRLIRAGRLSSDLSGFAENDESFQTISYVAGNEFGAGEVYRRTRQGAPAVELTYDFFGRLVSTLHTDASGSTVRQVEQTLTHSGPERVQQHILRTPDNNLDEVTVYEYDSAQRPRRVLSDLLPVAGPIMEVSNLTELGQPLEIRYGNGTRKTFTYGTRQGPGRLGTTTSFVPGLGVVGSPGSRAVRLRDYDVLGRPHALEESLTSYSQQNGQIASSTTLRRDSYDFDGLDQLGRAERSQDGVQQFHEQYRYDPLGNLAYVNDIRTSSASRTFVPHAGALDRLCTASRGSIASVAALPSPSSSGCTFQYDARGRVTQYVQPSTSAYQVSLQYTPYGEVRQIDWGGLTTAYRYGVGGVSERRYGAEVFAQLGPLQERPNDAVVGRVWERPMQGGMSLRGRPQDGVQAYAGQVSALGEYYTDAAGSESFGRTFRPYGEAQNVQSAGIRRSPQSSIAQWHGEVVCGYHATTFCKGELYRMGPRTYDAYLGRFLQPDPLLDRSSVLSANPYQYAWNDPSNHSDSSGLNPAFDEVGALSLSYEWQTGSTSVLGGRWLSSYSPSLSLGGPIPAARGQGAGASFVAQQPGGKSIYEPLPGYFRASVTGRLVPRNPALSEEKQLILRGMATYWEFAVQAGLMSAMEWAELHDATRNATFHISDFEHGNYAYYSTGAGAGDDPEGVYIGTPKADVSRALTSDSTFRYLLTHELRHYVDQLKWPVLEIEKPLTVGQTEYIADYLDSEAQAFSQHERYVVSEILRAQQGGNLLLVDALLWNAKRNVLPSMVGDSGPMTPLEFFRRYANVGASAEWAADLFEDGMRPALLQQRPAYLGGKTYFEMLLERYREASDQDSMEKQQTRYH
jgi:RHS repeat-associated protein